MLVGGVLLVEGTSYGVVRANIGWVIAWGVASGSTPVKVAGCKVGKGVSNLRSNRISVDVNTKFNHKKCSYIF